MSIHKPTEQEDAYFARQEYERLKKIHDVEQHQFEEHEKQHLKELHLMRCPKCGMQLVTIDYRGIAVDKCTCCAGIWLDAGELSAVVELEHPVMHVLLHAFSNIDEHSDYPIL